MAINQQHRQAQLVTELAEATRTLAQSTRDVSNPANSYAMLGDLANTIDGLEQVCHQLGAWHARVVNGTHYNGEDDHDGTPGVTVAAAQLERAAASLDIASRAIRAAHSGNAYIRWHNTAQ